MTICIFDNAEEFRIEIEGRFSLGVVADAAIAWKKALDQNMPRRISVDINEMTGYDPSGCALLREMQAHGTHIVAGTPRSLVFLDQISTPKRSLGPALVSKKVKTPFSTFRALAAGE